MAEVGYIKLFRAMTKWEWYKDSSTKDVFIHLILTANYEEKQWHGITIQRGQLVCSYANLALETGLSVKQVRTALKHLILTGEVAYEGHTKYSKITVTNYANFQDSIRNKEPQGQPNGTQPANEGQPNGTQEATTKEIQEIQETKKERNKEENIPPFPPKGAAPAFQTLADPVLQDKNQEPEPDLTVKAVIDFLNETAGTHYKSTIKKNRDLIKARQKEGFTLQDFKTVIEIKYTEWGKSEMRQYLRPGTLFGTNFESYLNQKLPPNRAEYQPKEGNIW